MSLFSRINGGRPTGSNSNTNNPGNRDVCKFYLEGRCKFGDGCKFYHPPREQGSQNRGQLPYNLDAKAIKADLTEGDDRPSWPLSAYGPGRDAPRELLEGAIEQSPEELRVQYYLGQSSGSTQQYEQYEKDAIAQARQQSQRILNDIDGAIKYVIDGKDQHPNREDMVQKGSGVFSWSEKPAFNQSANASSTGPTFGVQSSSSQPTSAFGQPSTFGSSSTFGNRPQTAAGSAFGQPSNLGSQTTSAFGQRSSAFGAPSALGSAGSAFGNPSPLGAGSGGGSAFGEASALGGTSPFGGGSQTNSNQQGTAFGQPSAPAGGSPFGKPSPFATGTTNTSAFGQPSTFGASSSQPSTNNSPFTQPSAPAQQQSAFGQSSNLGQRPSPFGQQQPTFGQSTPFGSSPSGAQSSSAFGQPSQAGNQSTFGTPSTFGASTNGSAFGQPSTANQQQSPFGSNQPSTTFGAQTTTNTSTFGQQQPSTASNNPPTVARAPGQPLTSWKGRPVISENRTYFYSNAEGKKERIWHPDGPPGPNSDVEAATPSVYDNETIAAALKQVYDYVREHGTFKDGLVPEIPPKREWVSWDL